MKEKKDIKSTPLSRAIIEQGYENFIRNNDVILDRNSNIVIIEND